MGQDDQRRGPQFGRPAKVEDLPWVFATLDEKLEAGEWAECTIYAPDSTGEPQSTGAVVKARDWLLGTGQEINSGSKVRVSKYGGVWYVVGAGC